MIIVVKHHARFDQLAFTSAKIWFGPLTMISEQVRSSTSG